MGASDPWQKEQELGRLTGRVAFSRAQPLSVAWTHPLGKTGGGVLNPLKKAGWAVLNGPQISWQSHHPIRTKERVARGSIGPTPSWEVGSNREMSPHLLLQPLLGERALMRWDPEAALEKTLVGRSGARLPRGAQWPGRSARMGRGGGLSRTGSGRRRMPPRRFCLRSR